MEIVFRNYLAGSWLLETEPHKWDAIVILDPGTHESTFVARHCPRYLILKFNDVDTIHDSLRPPATDDISAAMDFANRSDNLLVTCRAGQSRSAAIAFIIAFQMLGQESALKLWNPKRHKPNRLILKLANEFINDMNYRSSYEQWLDTNKHEDLKNYYDDIEAEYDKLESAGARNRIVEK